MRHHLFLLCISCLLVGCSQPAGSGNANSGTPVPSSPQTTTPVATKSAAATDVVATVLGQPVKRSDCLSPSHGIGSVEVGIYTLVFRLLMDDFSKSQQVTLSQDEIDAFWKALRAGAQQANPDPSKPAPEPVFDAAVVQTRLKQAQDKLAAADLPLLEQLALQSQVAGLQRGLELKSPAAMTAYENLLPLRLEAALYKKYGGKVVARQISLQAAGAYQKLAEEVQASGKLVFHDQALQQAFWKRLQDDLAHPEVPPERVDFSLPAWMQFAAQSPPTYAPTNSSAARTVNDPGMLERFAGVWHTTSTLKPSKWSPDGGSFTVREVTQPIFKGRYLLGREHSHPNGLKSLWLMTRDEKRNHYQFCIFDSAGLLGGQWELTWNAAEQTALGRAADTPPKWTSKGTNHFPDPNTNIVDVWMKDETGALLLDSHAEKKRQPADGEAAILKAWSKVEESPDRPTELDVLEPLIGTFDAVSVAKAAVWTPKEKRMTSVVKRDWILNRRFVFDHSVHSDGQESHAMISFDPQAKEYRSWWFNSEGHRNANRGQWDAATKTFSYRTEPEDGKTTHSTVRFISLDHHEWQIKVTDTLGTVYFDSTITTTRRP